MADVESLLIRIDASTEQLRRELRRADQQVAQSTSRIDRQLSAIDQRFAIIDRAAGLATKALAGYMAVFSVGAVVNWTRNQLDAADAIAKAAEVANLATGSLQELRYAFTQLSTLTDGQVDASLRRFNRRLGLAREEAGPAKAALDQLFGGVERFGSTEQALDAVIERLASVEDQAQRAALASAFFGDDAGPLLAAALGKGSAAVNQLRQDARELGFVLSDDLIENAGTIKDEFDRAQRILNTSFMSALTAATPLLVKMAEMATKIANALTTTPAEALHKELEDLRKRQDLLLQMRSRPTFLGRRPREDIDRELNEVNSRMLEVQQELQELQQKAAEVPAALAGGEWVPPEVLDQFERLESQLQRQLALYGQTTELAKVRYEVEHGSLQGLNDAQQKRLEQLAAELDAKAALTEQEKELDALRKEIEQASLERMDPVERERERYALQLENLRAFHEEKLITQEELWALELEAFLNHEAALAEAAKQGAREREQAERQAAAAIQAMRQQTASLAVGLLQTLGRENKAFALASIALTKGVAIAQTFAHTQTAATLAYASQLIPGVPSSLAAAQAAYAKTQAMGKLNMGLIAATGLVEAAQVMSDGGGALGTASNPVHTAPTISDPVTGGQAETGGVTHVNIQLDSRRTLLTREEAEGILDQINDILADGGRIGSVRLS